MNKPSTLPWTVLVDKANRQVKQARVNLNAAQARHDALQANLDRVNALIAEYQTREEEADASGRSMRDRINARAFIAQLNSVAARLTQETAQAAQAVEQSRRHLLGQEHEVLKMQKLAENAQRAERQVQNRREQKGYDDLALLRQNWLRDSPA